MCLHLLYDLQQDGGRRLVLVLGRRESRGLCQGLQHGLVGSSGLGEVAAHLLLDTLDVGLLDRKVTGPLYILNSN